MCLQVINFKFKIKWIRIVEIINPRLALNLMRGLLPKQSFVFT